MYFETETLSDRSSSPSSEDSFLSSDESSAEEAATPLDLQRAYFSSASYPESEPQTAGRQFLRKNETAYSNVSGTENILPIPARWGFCSDTRDQHGLAEDRREVVGQFVDSDGNPVAEWVEDLPPPPDKNYSHWHKQNGSLLSRALGYDPNVYRRKSEKEVDAVTNPPDNINGDAQYSAARAEEVKEQQEKLLWNQQRHAQTFSEIDAGRDMMDGYNMKLSAPQRVKTPLKHSWRESQPAPQAPMHAHSVHMNAPPSHGSVSAKRAELGNAFSRKPTPGSVVQLQSVSNLPITTLKTQREKPQPESLKGHAVVQMPLTADVGRALKDDPGELPTRSAHSNIDVRTQYAENWEREAADDVEISRIQAAYLELGSARHADSGEREGAEETPLKRAMDAKGAGTVKADAMREEQITLSEDAPRLGALRSQASHQTGGTVHAEQTLSEKDDAKNSKVGPSSAATPGRKVYSCVDAMASRREEHVTQAPLRAASSVSMAPIKIDEDRIPIDDEATFRFGAGASEAGALVASDVDQLKKDRARHVETSLQGMQSQLDAPSRKEIQPSRAESGSRLGPDRLTPAYSKDAHAPDTRVPACVSSSSDRETPLHMARSETPIYQECIHGEISYPEGRETPVRAPRR